MEKKRQLEIAQQIIDNFSKDLLHAVNAMPEDFDGFEIREAAVDYIKSEYGQHEKTKAWKARMKPYVSWKHQQNSRQQQRHCSCENRYFL